MCEDIGNLLREIENTGRNPRAFEEWKTYRDRLTDLVIRNSDAGSTLAVYGAGRCCDIDLGRLAEHFDKITLIDLDESAMEDALRRYGLGEDGRVKTQVFDFVGIRSEDYRALAQAMERALTECVPEDAVLSAAVQRVGPAIESIYGRFRKGGPFRAARYDVVLAAGLHSQLNRRAVSLWHTLCAGKGFTPDPIKDPVSALLRGRTPVIVANFNELLFYSAKKKAFVACELGIEGREGGVQGAMQAMADLERRERVRQIIRSGHSEALWPQNAAKGIIFRMGINEYTIRCAACSVFRAGDGGRFSASGI